MITQAYFFEATGRYPEDDDLDRVNCSKAGEDGHMCCGWNWEKNLPVFQVGPVDTGLKPKYSLGESYDDKFAGMEAQQLILELKQDKEILLCTLEAMQADRDSWQEAHNNKQAEVEALEARIEEMEGLLGPDWETYIELTKSWLEWYPADIFTGKSGDPGPVFVVAIRKALEALQEQGE